MRCNVCGLEYGLSHNCSGVVAMPSAEEVLPAPKGFAPFYYLQLAFKIVCWDDLSIRRASRDAAALYYGIAIWLATNTILFLFTAVPILLTRGLEPPAAVTIGLVVGSLVFLVIAGIATMIQIGLCHLVSKWFFAGTGTYLGILRPILLASFVTLLMLIPIAGPLAGGIASTAVLMMVFEEVEGIARLTAFGISATINILFFVVQNLLSRPLN
ncbi:MAG TPA: hypothetical protein VK525_20395 [Candidatus Saccharimonadales bacterium]|jgi:hypothetical protein|nr:hypothetical protein [Candidatus Saccharimonadales bacterium]